MADVLPLWVAGMNYAANTTMFLLCSPHNPVSRVFTEDVLKQLHDIVVERRQEWEDAKNPKHATSVFVCNRRIQKLNEALELIGQVELIDEYTKNTHPSL